MMTRWIGFKWCLFSCILGLGACGGGSGNGGSGCCDEHWRPQITVNERVERPVTTTTTEGVKEAVPVVIMNPTQQQQPPSQDQRLEKRVEALEQRVTEGGRELAAPQGQQPKQTQPPQQGQPQQK